VGVQQLPGLPAAAAAAGKALSSLLRKVPDAGHPLAQDCFRLLGGELNDLNELRGVFTFSTRASKGRVCVCVFCFRLLRGELVILLAELQYVLELTAQMFTCELDVC
jgi:hypothetical protein